MNRKTLVPLGVTLLILSVIQVFLYLRTLDKMDQISEEVSAYHWEVGKAHARFDRLEQMILLKQREKVLSK